MLYFTLSATCRSQNQLATSANSLISFNINIKFYKDLFKILQRTVHNLIHYGTMYKVYWWICYICVSTKQGCTVMCMFIWRIHYSWFWFNTLIRLTVMWIEKMYSNSPEFKGFKFTCQKKAPFVINACTSKILKL